MDFRGYTNERLEQILTRIIPRHSEYVRSMYWSVSYPALGNLRFVSVNDEHNPTVKYIKLDAARRSSILLEILKACKRLERLDANFYPYTRLDPRNTSPEFFIPMFKFIEPISKLKSLISLSLSAPDVTEAGSLPEDLLVLILKELKLLQSFTCSGISPNNESVSPLGLCLSRLECLSVIDLNRAGCVDLSWSQLIWTGRIQKLALRNCKEVTLEALHRLSICFASTLYELKIDPGSFHSKDFRTFNPRIHHSDIDPLQRANDILRNLLSGGYIFNLPRLHILHLILPFIADGSTASFPEHLKPFTVDCKELVELHLVRLPGLAPHFLKRLITDRVWPKLKKLAVTTTRVGTMSSADLEHLELLCDHMQIELLLDEEDEDFDDLDHLISDLDEFDDV